MRQLFLEKGLLEVKEVCQPLLDDYSVLVDVSYSFISSGKDFAKILANQKDQFFHNVPAKIKKLFDLIMQQGGTYTRQVIKNRRSRCSLPVGHSCSGKVIAVGKNVKHFRPGDLVACAGTGFAHHAEIVCVPEHLVVSVSHEKFLKTASLTGIGSIALQSIRRASLSLGEFVCILGVDTLGQLLIQMARLAGARVIAVDLSPEKLELAKKSGAEFVCQLNGSVQDIISHITQGHGVDCVIVSPEYISTKEAHLAFGITRKQGRLIFVGNKSMMFEQEFLQQKEVNVIFSLTYGPGRYDPDYEYEGHDYPYEYVRWTENRNMSTFMHLVKNDQLTLDTLVGKEISLDVIDENSTDTIIKQGLGVIVSYPSTEQKIQRCPSTQEMKFIPARKAQSDKLNVTFFGADRSTRLLLLPIVKNVKGVKIHRIIDRDISRALNTSKLYMGALALSGDPELFYDDQETDVVCIMSHELLHAEHIFKALKNGKTVYLNHPFAFSEEELGRLKCAMEYNKNAQFCIGYYRSYAPFMQKIKKQIINRRSPLVINYHLNLSALEGQTTIDLKPRFGNVVDKASHIFDLFHYLTEAKPVSVSVETVRSSREHVYLSDNFVAQLSMSDGSLCSLTVTSLGHRDNAVERMDLNYDGKTVIMEDFVRLIGFGLPKGFDEVVRIPDKGKEIFTKRFFSELMSEQKSLFFDTDRLNLISHITATIDQLVCQGGGELSL